VAHLALRFAFGFALTLSTISFCSSDSRRKVLPATLVRISSPRFIRSQSVQGERRSCSAASLTVKSASVSILCSFVIFLLTGIPSLCTFVPCGNQLDWHNYLNSSRKSSDQILGTISRKRAEALLLEWVNLLFSEDQAPWQRLAKRFPEIFGGLPLDGFNSTPYEIAKLRSYLRKAWDAPDRRHRDWYIFHLRMKYSEWGVQHGLPDFDWNKPIPIAAVDAREEPPQITPLESAMFYFQVSLGDKARHCSNPTCPAPYFFAIKRGQKYCSTVCAEPAQREAKRKWWSENRAKNGGIE
jgi:hypothetical protein